MKKLLLSALVLVAGAVSGCGTTPASTDKCEMVTCAAGTYCDGATGMCRAADKCMGKTCAAGQACDGATGMCVALDRCATVSCTGGQSCNRVTGACENPALPALGPIIERMGRPAVNTALTNPFDLYRPLGGTTPTESGDLTKDRYNRDDNPANWVTNWSPAVRMHLAILDGLDGGTCGNQLAFNAAMMYGTMTTVLSGDALQMNTTRGTCNQYLGVELAALGIANTDCGGRTLSMDVIDTTYSALAIGATTGVNDGIAQATPPTATFPFMTSPQ